MRKLLLAAAIAAAGLSATMSWADTAPATSAPLIERAKLFGNPSRVAGKLSPDGKWLAWIAPRDGVLNVWVALAGAPDQAKPLTAEKQRPIRQYFWAPDSSSVLYVNDHGGDENFLLYKVGVQGGEPQSLTPFQKTRVRVVGNDVYAYTGSRAVDAARPSVVFIHGAGNDHSVWALQSRYFAYHGWNALAVDLPAHGRSGGVPLATVEALGDWALAHLDVIDRARRDFDARAEANAAAPTSGAVRVVKLQSRSPPSRK